jgi:hypothetical protein
VSAYQQAGVPVTVEWRGESDDPDLEVHDLWINGRIAQYDVPVEEREYVLRSWGVTPTSS